jgi:hypothetical protein
VERMLTGPELAAQYLRGSDLPTDRLNTGAFAVSAVRF